MTLNTPSTGTPSAGTLSRPGHVIHTAHKPDNILESAGMAASHVNFSSVATSEHNSDAQNDRMQRSSNERLVWIVDDDRSIRWVLERALSQSKLAVRSFESANDAVNALSKQTPSVVLTDVRMPGMDGFEFLATLKNRLPELPVVIMTAHSDLDSAVHSYQSGAFEYLPKPFDVDEAVAVVQRALIHASELEAPRPDVEAAQLPEIIGQAPAMQEVFRAIGRLSQSNITVLINGESGTGKELVAHALHRHSPRANGPFVALNMAAIPRELMESELFGHEKGAFTGANQLRAGRFEQADSGTLFLDEIGDMPADTQTRLLRVLADGEFFRVGGHQSVKVDVRIIAATHQNLEKLVADGSFREDLFHRLNVIRVHLPRLSERSEDVPVLARHFLIQAARELDCEPKELHETTEALLSGMPWPGNVRQLENLCRWLTVMAAGREVFPVDLPAELHDVPVASPVGDWEDGLRNWATRELSSFTPGSSTPLLDQATPRFEQILIRATLAHTGGRRRDAADILGWGRNTLTRKIKELGMDDELNDREDTDSDQDS